MISKLGIIIVLLAAAVWSPLQIIDSLDLTAVNDGPSDGNGIAGELPTYGSAPPPPIALTVTISSTNFVLWERFVGTYTLQNNGTASLVLPWSGYKDSTEVPPSGRRQLRMNLVISRNPDLQKVIDSSIVYGNDSTPSTVKTLPPGASVVIYTSGTWAFQSSFVTQYLLPGGTDFELTAEASMRLADEQSWSQRVQSTPIPIQLHLPH